MPRGATAYVDVIHAPFVISAPVQRRAPRCHATRTICVFCRRDLAAQNHYPAIDVSVSASRVMSAVTSPDHRAAAGKVRELIASYRKAEDLINIGAYQRGSNPTIDRAIAQIDAINQMLRQGVEEKVDHQMSLRNLLGIVNAYGAS